MGTAPTPPLKSCPQCRDGLPQGRVAQSDAPPRKGILHHTMVALRLQQFQYKLKNGAFGAPYFLYIFLGGQVNKWAKGGGLQGWPGLYWCWMQGPCLPPPPLSSRLRGL